MKAKQFFLFLLTITFVYSCNTKPAKESKPEVKQEAPKKEVVKEAPNVYGIDISFYQGTEINSLSPGQDSIQFIFSKATQGAGMVDPRFQQNWILSKEKGFIRGAYHFYMTSDDPVAQANNFISAIRSIEATDIPPVIDFEMGGIANKNETPQAIATSLKLFIETIQKELGRKPMIYTDIPTANTYLKDPFFSTYALWIANYVNKPQPDLPLLWQQAGWTFWQRSDNYKVESFTNDFDVFNGDMTKLKTFIENYK